MIRRWLLRLRLLTCAHFHPWQRNWISDVCRNHLQSMTWLVALAREASINNRGVEVLVMCDRMGHELRRLEAKIKAVGA
jgi:hypothetical protein